MSTKTVKSTAPRILVVDIGGSSVKCLASGHTKARKFASGPRLTPARMVEGVLAVAEDWQFDVLSIGYPGVVKHGAIVREPHNLGQGWVGFDFAAAFSRPVRLINDAAMQALGSYRGGKMLFLGLGTGLGSALIIDDVIVAMELGHLHWTKNRTYEDFVGKRGYRRLGARRWRRAVHRVVQDFSDALLPDDIVVGGGRARQLERLPRQARLGDNTAAFVGGFRLWDAQSPGFATDPRSQRVDRLS